MEYEKKSNLFANVFNEKLLGFVFAYAQPDGYDGKMPCAAAAEMYVWCLNFSYVCVIVFFAECV